MASLKSKTEEVMKLEASRAKVEISGMCLSCHLSQTFENESEAPVECRYELCLAQTSSTAATVCAFTATLPDGRVIVAEVQEKRAAERRYDDAIAAGHGAYLLEKTGDSTFAISIGSLRPHGKVTIDVSFVAEVDRDSLAVAGEAGSRGVVKFVLPSSKGPVSSGFAGEVVDISFAAGPTVVSISSPSHPTVGFSRSSPEASEFTATVPVDAELVVRAEIEPGLSTPTAAIEEIVAKDGTAGGAAAMLCFFPKISSGLALSAGELWFILDCSGSMSGTRMRQALEALDVFLRSLPPGSFFNIVRFGSTAVQMFPTAIAYDDASLSQATERLAKVSADLGGTNVLPALHFAFAGGRKLSGSPRSIFVLTDGDIENPTEVVECIRAEVKSDSRVFTVGISGCNPPLLSRMSLIGHGTSEVVGESESMRAVVIRQLKRALAPALIAPRLDWGPLQEFVVFQEPTRDFFFEGDRLVLYALMKPGAEKLIASTLVKFLAENTAPQDVRFIQAPRGSKAVQTLVAWARVRTLSSRIETEAKEEALSLCLRFSIASKFASFVAVETRKEATMASAAPANPSPEPVAPAASAATPAARPVSTTTTSRTSGTGGGMRLFGRKKPVPPTMSDTISRLRETVDLLDKREALLQRRIDAMHQAAKTAAKSGNKAAALMQLKKKLLYEQQASRVIAKRVEIEQTTMNLESAGLSGQALEAMRTGAASMRQVHSSYSVDQVDEAMDDIREQMGVSEISDALSSPVGAGLCEEDLEKELESLAEDTLSPVTVSAPAPLKALPPKSPARTEEDELAELEKAMFDSSAPAPASTHAPAAPVAPVVATVPTEPEGKLHRIVTLQLANGVWHWSDSLAALLGRGDVMKKLLELTSKDEKFSQCSSDALATAIVVAFLRTDFRNLVDTDLELLVNKSLSWLEVSLHSGRLVVENLISLATKCL